MASCIKEVFVIPICITNDYTVPVTFDNQIIEIVNRSCGVESSTGSCHQAVDGIANFTSYEDLEFYATSGDLDDCLFNNPTMPPANADESQLLTTCDLDYFRAWIDAGAPEK